MFTFISGSDPKSRDGKRAINKNDRKKAKQFAKGVTRFLRYNKDLLPEEKYDEISGLREQFMSDASSSTKKRSR